MKCLLTSYWLLALRIRGSFIFKPMSKPFYLAVLIMEILVLAGPKNILAQTMPPSGVIREFADTNYYWYENKNLEAVEALKIWALVLGYMGVSLVLAYQLGNAAEILTLPRREINFIYLAKTD